MIASENKLQLASGAEVPYDVLVLNVGSRTRDANAVKGIWEHGLTTRPINDLIGKIQRKE